MVKGLSRTPQAKTTNLLLEYEHVDSSTQYTRNVQPELEFVLPPYIKEIVQLKYGSRL